MEEYNGYYNYNVWNVKLWADNEYDLYQALMKVFSDFYEKKINAKQLMQGINRIGAMAHRRSDIKNKKLTGKEIQELRKVFKQDYKEYKEYRDKEGHY